MKAIHGQCRISINRMYLFHICLSLVFPWALLAQEQVEINEQQQKTNRAARYIQKGQELEEVGDYRGAIMDYDEAIRLDDEYADAYLYRAHAKLRNGDSDGAGEDADAAEKLNPEDDRIYHIQASVRLIKEMYLEAFQEVKKALELNPDSPSHLALRANIKEKLEDFDGAIEDYSAILKRHPHMVENYIYRAEAKIDKGDYKSAIKDLNRIIRHGEPTFKSYAVQPVNIPKERVILAHKKEMLANDAIFKRAEAYIRMGKVNKALEDYTRIIRSNPNEAILYFSRALIYYGQKRYEEARRDISKSIKLTDQNDFENLDYKYIWYWLTERHFIEEEACDALLEQYVKRRKDNVSDIWTESIFEFILGGITEKKLFERAHVGKTPKRVSEQYCEAWFYAAQLRLFEENLPEAGRFLKQCITANIRSFFEDRVARIQLADIEELIGPID